MQLNRYFQAKDFWDKKDIEERAEYFADIALGTWGYLINQLPRNPVFPVKFLPEIPDENVAINILYYRNNLKLTVRNL
ncbi:hypothetical protein CENA302_07265 [Cylindrospermopsis raciborskii CENA302]|uniref:Uncharacterized protein n=1 Tax=Cylindrospermopsis raciborskii CENA302 TaxID=1170768 RepID=A0A9Q5W9W9_9CYAN|nr:hypothetical protein CENA302_07265 [Cylindrospermopsis raciborskii CENA302]